MNIKGYFKKIQNKSNKKKAVNCVCTYNGEMYESINGKRKELHLNDLPMPFKSKYQIITK